MTERSFFHAFGCVQLTSTVLPRAFSDSLPTCEFSQLRTEVSVASRVTESGAPAGLVPQSMRLALAVVGDDRVRAGVRVHEVDAGLAHQQVRAAGADQDVVAGAAEGEQADGRARDLGDDVAGLAALTCSTPVTSSPSPAAPSSRVP